VLSGNIVWLCLDIDICDLLAYYILIELIGAYKLFIFSFIMEIKEDFDLFRKGLDVVVHSSQDDNERNEADDDRPQR
jgi:hypothetical protein